MCKKNEISVVIPDHDVLAMPDIAHFLLREGGILEAKKENGNIVYFELYDPYVDSLIEASGAEVYGFLIKNRQYTTYGRVKFITKDEINERVKQKYGTSKTSSMLLKEYEAFKKGGVMYPAMDGGLSKIFGDYNSGNDMLSIIFGSIHYKNEAFENIAKELDPTTVEKMSYTNAEIKDIEGMTAICNLLGRIFLWEGDITRGGTFLKCASRNSVQASADFKRYRKLAAYNNWKRK